MNPLLNLTNFKATSPFLISADANPEADNYEFLITTVAGAPVGTQDLTVPALEVSALKGQPGDYVVEMTASGAKGEGETLKASFTVTATEIINFKEVTPVAATAPAAPAGNAPAGTTPPAANAAAAGTVPPVIPAAGTAAPVATTAAAAGTAAALAATNPAGTAAPAAQPAQPVTPQPTPWQRNRQKILFVLGLLATIAATIWATWYFTTEHNKGGVTSTGGQQTNLTTATVDTNAIVALAKQMALELNRQQQAPSMVNNTNARLGSINGTGNIIEVGDIKESDGAMIGNNFYMWSNSSPASAVQTVKELAKAVTAAGSMWPKGCTNVVKVTVHPDKLGQPTFKANDTQIVPGTMAIIIPPSNSWDVECGLDPFPNATVLWMDTEGKVHPLTVTPGRVRDHSRDSKNLLQYLVFPTEGAGSATLSVLFTKL